MRLVCYSRSNVVARWVWAWALMVERHDKAVPVGVDDPIGAYSLVYFDVHV
jgi:hypothetical protein